MTATLPETLWRRLAAVDGQIIEEEGRLLFALASRVPRDQIIVEIGAYKGKSSCYLAAGALSGRGALVYSVDLWRSAPWPLYALPEVRQAWTDNVGHLGLSGAVLPIEADTAAAEREIEGVVGLLFVDSDHSYEGACRDIETWAGRVAAGGPMVFHDATSDHWGVRQAIQDKLLATGLYRRRTRWGCAVVRRVR